MKLPTMRLLTTALAFTLAAPLFAAELGTQNTLIAHEWGTFTSVAGPDGDPVRWSALTGPPDLPCFVARGPQYKGSFSGLVRMETPVLYFYSPKQMKLSVNVQFPLGDITDWYPNASHTERTALTWDSVELTPNEHPAFPTTQGESRYFAARNTDATPLNIAGQREKMIFYRGVGGFAIPLRPRFIGDGDLGTSGSGVEIRNIGKDPIPLAILFENRGGVLRYRIQSDLLETTTIGPLKRQGSLTAIRSAIVEALVKRGGLYPKEAQAMIDTWNDSWFEEGTRLIYLLPQPAVDAVLPLTIQPAPQETTRAFIGRIEMLSPAMKQDIQAAVASGDSVRLAKYGRFLEAFAGQLRVPYASAAYKLAADSIQGNISPNSCVR